MLRQETIQRQERPWRMHWEACAFVTLRVEARLLCLPTSQELLVEQLSQLAAQPLRRRCTTWRPISKLTSEISVHFTKRWAAPTKKRNLFRRLKARKLFSLP